MKYHFYKNYLDIPKYIEKQVGDNIYTTDNPLLSLKDDTVKGLDKNKYIMMFVTKDKELVGLLSIVYIPLSTKKLMNLNFSEKTFEIKNVFILPNFRGQGICQKMLTKIKDFITENNIAKRLKLDVSENNIPAIKCYKTIGFKVYKNTKAQKWLNDNFKKMYGFQLKNKSIIYTLKI